jgi:hypothetical protein
LLPGKTQVKPGGEGQFAAGRSRGGKRRDRLEIATALRANFLVVPVLVGNAGMPSADDFPADLQPLWRRNARELSDPHWDYDAEELVKSISDS